MADAIAAFANLPVRHEEDFVLVNVYGFTYQQVAGYRQHHGQQRKLRSEKRTKSEQKFDDMLAAISSGIAALPDDCRETYILIRIHDLTYEQAADYFDVSIAMIARRMRQSYVLLGAHMDHLGLGRRPEP